MDKDTLQKSIDSLIDGLFAEEAPKADKVEKSMVKDMPSANKTTADEAAKQAPKAEKDESRGAGRPEQISSVPQTDQDGERSGQYDGDIAKKQEDAKKKEDSQVEPPKDMKKSWEASAEYQEYISLKKASEANNKAEELRKARQETSDLIKSAITEAVTTATTAVKAENESLRKSLEEQGDLIKAMANKPQRSKAVTGVQALEKSFGGSQPTGSGKLSKAELLDIGEELVKSKQLTMENVIELENTGYIYDPEARGILERAVARRK